MSKGKSLKKEKGTKGGRGRRRPLRGKTLVRAAHVVLERWASLSPETHPINILRLSKELGVTRQAIYDNELKEVVNKYKALQQKNFTTQRGAKGQRKPLEERIIYLKKELMELRSKLDGWIERWVAIEYNARMLGIDADKIFAPMPPPNRKLPKVSKERSKEKSDDDEE